MSGKSPRRIRPRSNLHSLQRIDQRTKAGQLYRRVHTELTAAVGGNPDFTQRLLIERCAIMQVRLAMIDEEILAGRMLSDIGDRSTISWANCLRRTLAQLGIRPVPDHGQAFSDVMAELGED
jgi:hypothetical protein